VLKISMFLLIISEFCILGQTFFPLFDNFCDSPIFCLSSLLISPATVYTRSGLSVDNSQVSEKAASKRASWCCRYSPVLLSRWLRCVDDWSNTPWFCVFEVVHIPTRTWLSVSDHRPSETLSMMVLRRFVHCFDLIPPCAK